MLVVHLGDNSSFLVVVLLVVIGAEFGNVLIIFMVHLEYYNCESDCSFCSQLSWLTLL